MTDEPAKPVFEIDSDLPMPRLNGGRIPIDDSALIVRARAGRRNGQKFKSRNDAASKLAKDAEGNSPEAATRRLNSKFKDAGIE